MIDMLFFVEGRHTVNYPDFDSNESRSRSTHDLYIKEKWDQQRKEAV